MPDGRPVRLLIVGATGGTGRQLVAQALERGHTVTALAREQAALGVSHPRLQVLQGDVLDYSSVEAAVHGQEAVISALGHKRFVYPTRILSEGTRNLLRAMEVQGVQRFVCETALGIGDSAGRMGLYYTFFCRSDHSPVLLLGQNATGAPDWREPCQVDHCAARRPDKRR